MIYLLKTQQIHKYTAQWQSPPPKNQQPLLQPLPQQQPPPQTTTTITGSNKFQIQKPQPKKKKKLKIFNKTPTQQINQRPNSTNHRQRELWRMMQLQIGKLQISDGNGGFRSTAIEFSNQRQWRWLDL